MRNFFDSESTGLWDSDATEYFKVHILEETDNILERVYDFADYAYDIRMSEQHDIKKLLLGLLEKLCDYPDQYLIKARNDNSDFPHILYQLTLGNVCLRLNQLYLNLYDYEEAEKWYQRAIEAFWIGKNQIYTELDSNQSNTTLNIYKYLSMLNIGKCYRNFAIQNRRSDFNAAEERFSIAVNELKNTVKDRKLALIYLEALINLARIKRLKYDFTDAENAYNDFDEEFENVKNLIEEKDRDRFKAQLAIERGLLFRKARNNKAVELFFEVAKDSYLASENKPSEYNVDAINNLSSSIRKIGNSSEQVVAYEKYIQQLKFKVYSISSNLNEIKECGLLGQLRYYAHEGNMYALREYVQWYAIYLSDHSNITAKTLIELDRPGYPSDSHMASGLLTTDKAISFLGMGLDYILHNTDRINENIKHSFQYTLFNISRQLDALIIRFPIKIEEPSADSKKKKYTLEKWNLNIERNNTKKPKKNLQLQYLKCVFFVHLGCYSIIHDTLLELCARKELDYIRRGTHGLKVRYLLAKDYMASGLYEHAAEVLEEIRNELQAQFQSQSSCDKTDISTELSYGACLMQLGRFLDAKQTVYNNPSTIEEVEKLSADSDKKDEYYADYALCLLHLDEIDEAFEKYNYLNNKHSRASLLLHGYLEILRNDQENEVEKYKQAYKDFKEAYENFCERSTYKHHLMEMDSKSPYPEPNKMKLRKETECRTAYIITLIKLWDFLRLNGKGKDKAKEGYQDKIIRFIVDIPRTASLSLESMFRIANWIKAYEKDFTDCDSHTAVSMKKKKIIKRLYQSFARCELYPERGVRAFQELKDSSEFRYFQGEQQGRILVHLFCMYEHIKWIKRHLCLTTGELRDNKKIVHYTKVDTLKALIHVPAKGESAPRFRVSNCGYMNDVFEGTVFLEMLVQPEELVQPVINQYFPQWKSNEQTATSEEKSLIPLAKNVYIASFSTDSDSFAMWSIYSKDETGCAIQFEEHFFDIRDENKTSNNLKAYFVSRYTDNDYPLYKIQYLKKSESNGEYHIVTQTGDIKEPEDLYLKKEIKALGEDIISLEKYISNGIIGNENQKMGDSIKYIRSFAADRLNEVRFLFKSSIYSYEHELRLVVTTKEGKINDIPSCPCTYAEILRDIKDITVTLGSKIDAITVDQLVTWMAQTGKVKAVMHSNLNWPV